MSEHAQPAPVVGGFKHGRVPRAVRAAQLLDLAEQLFIEHGYDRFAIEDLCRAAQVSRPVVYAHFGSKEVLYLEVLRRIRDEFEASLLGAAAQAGDIEGALRKGAEAYFQIIARDPARWSLVYGASAGLVGPMAEELYELRAATVRKIADVIELFLPGADPVDVLVAANAVSGSGEQLGRWWLHSPQLPIEQLVDKYWTCCYGIYTAMAATKSASEA
jgi:AcrR family transcriptional regulator